MISHSTFFILNFDFFHFLLDVNRHDSDLTIQNNITKNKSTIEFLKQKYRNIFQQQKVYLQMIYITI